MQGGVGGPLQLQQRRPPGRNSSHDIGLYYIELFTRSEIALGVELLDLVQLDVGVLRAGGGAASDPPVGAG